MKILAVDFDGVISDSALKSLFVSHNAYCKYFGPRVKRSFGGELFTFDNWEEMEKQYKKEMDYYHRLRSYIELSGDFFAIIKIVNGVRLHKFTKCKTEIECEVVKSSPEGISQLIHFATIFQKEKGFVNLLSN